MAWGFHPDTLYMARASGLAVEACGEQGTLVYLRAYRAEYSKIIESDARKGGEKYLESLDKAIAGWELKGRPVFKVFAPRMN